MAGKKEIRIDRGTLRLNAEKTPEGYLKASAKVARTGVFPYRNADGSVRYELRHPDDVFTRAAIDSLKGIPITLEHPRQMLTAANAKELSVGHVGNDVHADAPFIEADLVITDAEAIRAIEAGKQELSCGYYLDIVEDAGIFEGQAYTHRQKNIRENHLAITDKARLGPELRINSDLPCAFLTEVRANSTQNEEPKMVKVTINGITYDAAPEVANELARLNTAAEAVKAEKVATQAKLDTMTAERDDKKAKLDALEKDGPAQIAAAAKSRASLLATAAKAVDAETSKKLDTMDDLAIKKAVIMSKAPKGTNLDGQSAEYVQARFDLTVENLDGKNADEALAESRRKAAPRNDNNDGAPDQDKAREKMINRHRDGWKPEADKK